MTRPSTIFYSLSAQPDNIGDIEIRKEVLSWIRESGREIVLFVGPMPQGYLVLLSRYDSCAKPSVATRPSFSPRDPKSSDRRTWLSARR
jgi:hypothetical protein